MEDDGIVIEGEEQAPPETPPAEESTETETPAKEPTGAENPAPDEKEPDPLINQEAVQKKINSVIFRQKEEERKRQAAEKELEQYRQQMQRLREKEQEIPPAPDPFADDYSQQLAQREEMIRKQAIAQAERDWENKQRQRQAEDDMRRRQAEINENVDRMRKTALKYGISDAEFDEADQRVSMFVKDPALANFLISHEKAPLIVKHLSNSIAELEKISSMDPVTAAGYIASTIVPQAEKLRPQLSNAPKPLDVPDGKGAPQKIDKYLEGFTFE